MSESAYRTRLLAILMSIMAFNYVDRLALGIVLQDIKVDLQLSDTQLGFLTGIAFAFFYSVMGIPIARWADRGNRVTIISLTTALWSITVSLCGIATSFAQLLLIRVGTAVGEAGCIPPAHSLIADHFPRAERPRAVARYMLGLPLALIVGYFGAGWLNELYGWRITFIALGLPGVVLALLARFALKEPRRMNVTVGSLPAQVNDATLSGPSVKQVLYMLFTNVTLRHLTICFSVWYFFGYGLLQWQPAFFIRSHGIQSGELGVWLAVIYGGGGLLGTYIGGEWASRYARDNERFQLVAMALLFLVFGAFCVGSYLAPTHILAFGLLSIAAVGGAVTNGPLLATIQTLVPASMRAESLALIYLFANLIGMGLGPLAAGALSDLLRPEFGEESLRYALILFCPGYFWAAWHLWRASLSVSRDIAAADQAELPITNSRANTPAVSPDGA